jgi:hypothetical protein
LHALLALLGSTCPNRHGPLTGVGAAAVGGVIAPNIDAVIAHAVRAALMIFIYFLHQGLLEGSPAFTH